MRERNCDCGGIDCGECAAALLTAYLEPNDENPGCEIFNTYHSYNKICVAPSGATPNTNGGRQ